MGNRLSNERYEEIKRIVVEVFVKYGISRVPVDVFELATKMGIRVTSYSSCSLQHKAKHLKLSEDGYCVLYENDLWEIFYNDAREVGRINNTIMHELGHIVLGHSEESELSESEANFFAKYALVPPILVHLFGLNNPYDMASIFHVSLTAAFYAYSYYQKWLRFGPVELTEYEKDTLELFGVAHEEVFVRAK